jgi:putative transposase
MLLEFPKLVKAFFLSLSDNDFPVLNTRLFISCWLALVLDKSTVSMRDLFKRLGNTGIPMDISTFSKACKTRSIEPFISLYETIRVKVRHALPQNELLPCPIDSTTIGLTSKLLWKQGYHQVKLFSCLESSSGSTEGSLLSFGYAHDSNYTDEMLEAIPENGVGIFDRGFCGREKLKSAGASGKYFLMRINRNFNIELDEESGLMQVGTGKDSRKYRMVWFCDVENKAEYRLATNLPSQGEWVVSDEEVMELYRKRWGIELLWKFLKMHLKLDRLITKSVNGVEMQIYTTLIAHLLLQLLSVPKMWGVKLIDKLRYLQCCMCQEVSFVHWLGKLLQSRGSWFPTGVV